MPFADQDLARRLEEARRSEEARLAEQRREAANEINVGALFEGDALPRIPDEDEPRTPDEAYRRAVRQGQAAVAAHFGTLLEEEGDLVSAEAAYRTAISGGDGTGALNLGRLLVARGDLAEAEGAYRWAVEFGPPEVAEVARAALVDLGVPSERTAAATGQRTGRGTPQGGEHG